MGYSDQINILKNALNGYSAEEDKLTALYKAAIENAEKAHAEKQKQLDAQYYRDRNEVYADNARDERNLNNTLAARGLGFSGEAAQAKLNANITLNNRLGALTREKNNTALQYELDLAENKSKLSMEEAEKFKELLNSRNSLNAEIAAMELERENSEADRAAEKEASNAKLQAEKEANAAKLQAEKELQAAKLQAEKDMLSAELNAKYYAGSSSGGSGGSGGINAEQNEEESKNGYIPDITAKELANKVTGGSYIDSDTHEYMVNKYLLELRENYNIDPDYYNELVFMLKAYGYEEISEPEMRALVISHEAKSYYDSKYGEIYDSYIMQGLSEGNAHKKTAETIKDYQLDFIYKRTENLTEFRMCCEEAGISNTDIQEYINRINSNKAKAGGTAGGGGGYTAKEIK